MDIKTFEFLVKRAGDDPMVVMIVSERHLGYGDHGKTETFEVTLTDKKSIEFAGW